VEVGVATVFANAGRRVLMLEHAASAWWVRGQVRAPPFRFDASLRALDGLTPGGGNDTLLKSRGIAEQVELTRLDPLYVLRMSSGDLSVPADFFAYEQMLVGMFRLSGLGCLPGDTPQASPPTSPDGWQQSVPRACLVIAVAGQFCGQRRVLQRCPQHGERDVSRPGQQRPDRPQQEG